LNLKLLAVIALAVILAVISFDLKLYTGGDNVTYILLAKSIISGGGYHEIWTPQNTSHTSYPPGYPILLASLMLLFGDSLFVYKMLSLVFFLGCVILFWVWIKHRTKDWWYFLPVILFVLSPDVLNSSHLELSEMCFTFFLLLGLFLFDRWRKEDSVGWFFLLSFSTIACFYIRTIGLAAVGGLLIHLVYNRKFSYAGLHLLATIALMGGWFFYTYVNGSTYLEQMLSANAYSSDALILSVGGFFSRIWTNIELYWTYLVPYSFFPLLSKPVTWLGLGLGMSVLWGLKKNWGFAGLIFLCYFGALLIWPEQFTNQRFLLPVLPLLFFFCIEGLHFNFLRLAISAGATVCLLVVSLGQISTNKADYSPDWKAFFNACEWIKQYTLEDAVILSRKPNMCYYLAERKSIIYPFSTDKVKVRNSVKQADYVLFDMFDWTNTTQRYLLPVIENDTSLIGGFLAFPVANSKAFVLAVKK